MSAAPFVFKKNKIDLDNENISISVTDSVATDTGEDFADQIRDRKNNSGWATTDSADSALTLLEVLFGEERDIDTIFMILHNFKNYDIEWYDGATWTSIVSISGNSDPVSFHQFSQLTALGIRVRVNKTFIVDDDKFLAQLIVTEELGRFEQFPEITHESSKNRKRLRMVSGKSKIIQNSGAVDIRVRHNNQEDDNDLTLVEQIFNTFSGVLIWLCGNDESQFRTRRIGFRREDLFLVAPSNEYENPWGSNGRYCEGTDYDLRLVEVV